MSVSLPVIVGAGVVIVALLCIGVTARRRQLRADAAASEMEPVEAVFVDDMPGELQSFVAPVAPHSEPAAAHAQVYPVHKLQQAVVEAPITFGPPRRDALDEPVAETEPPFVVRETTLEAVPDLSPEIESLPAVVQEPEIANAPDVHAPVVAHERKIERPVEQEFTVEAAPRTEPTPTPEVASLTAQIEVLSETIARLTDRLDAAVAAVAPAPVAESSATELEPEPVPEPVMLRSVAYEPEAAFALEAELEADVEPDAEPEVVSVIEPEPPRPQPMERADRTARPPVGARPAAEPATYTRKRVDDDLLAWPSDEDLEQFSGRQARRDI